MTQSNILLSHVSGHELSISGPISIRTSDSVRHFLHTAIQSGTGDIVVHMRDGEILDATGLGVLVGAHHRAKMRGRRFVIADASPKTIRLMCATRLNHILGGDSFTFVRLSQACGESAAMSIG